MNIAKDRLRRLHVLVVKDAGQAGCIDVVDRLPDNIPDLHSMSPPTAIDRTRS